jgi:hypothetical protein
LRQNRGRAHETLACVYPALHMEPFAQLLHGEEAAAQFLGDQTGTPLLRYES